MCYVSHKVTIDFREVWNKHFSHRNKILSIERFNNRYDVLTIYGIGRWVHDKLNDTCYRIFGAVHTKDRCLMQLRYFDYRVKYVAAMPKP